MRRCVCCHLQENYPGVFLDDNSKCVFCRKEENSSKEEKIHYLGSEAMMNHIAEIKKRYETANAEYDGILGLSGGIDSTYLLYLLTQVYHLKILAVSMTHRFMPPETLENIKRITSLLGVKNEFVPNPYLDKWADYFIRNWSHHPTAPTLISFCTGCRYGLHHLLPQTAKKYNIHIMFSGVNHFEASLYKRNIVCLDPNHPTFAGFFLGYGREILKNLHYCKHPAGLLFQAKEFFSSRSMDNLRVPSFRHPFMIFQLLY